MNKRIGIVIRTLVLIVICWGLYSVFSLIFIRYQGKQIEATVVGVDIDCDRYNSIQVLYSGQQYAISISREDCQNHIYHAGQKVRLLKIDTRNELVWPESQPVWALICILIVIGISAWTFWGNFGRRSIKNSSA